MSSHIDPVGGGNPWSTLAPTSLDLGDNGGVNGGERGGDKDAAVKMLIEAAMALAKENSGQGSIDPSTQVT